MRALAAVALVVAAGAVAALALAQGGGPSHQARHVAAVAPKSAKSRPRVATPQRVHGPHDDPVPILMYHVISAPKPGAPYPELYTPEPEFAAQMKALAQRGYHGVTLGQVYDYWHHAVALPKRPIVIS